jgi:hypothetical protein
MFLQKMLTQYLGAIALFLGVCAALGTLSSPSIGQQNTQSITTHQTIGY